VAEDIVDVQSNNQYLNGFCIHSNTHVEVNSNNYFESNVIVSMPDRRDIVMPNSGLQSNDGLSDALRDRTYKMRILNRLEEIIDNLFAGGDRFAPDYVSGSGLIDFGSNTKKVNADDFTTGRIHTKYCSSKGSITIEADTVLSNVVLVTNCQIKYGNGVVLENVILATSNTGDKSVTGSHIQIGRDDNCAKDGGSQILTMGGFHSSSHIKTYGGQIIAMGDIDFAANADGIAGASFISGGRIDGTSNMTMGFCGDGMERNFSAVYFRMVQ